jgi:hypothetical protein
MVHNEEVADFRKLDFIDDKDYLTKRKALKSPTQDDSNKVFYNYCNAVIKQQKNNHLSIREASYAIANSTKHLSNLDNKIKLIIQEAICLKRHPSNYKLDHQAGWKDLVSKISAQS